MTVKADYTKIIVRNLRHEMTIGIYDHEKIRKQPVVVNVEITVKNQDWESDDFAKVLNYEAVVAAIQDIAAAGHINLVETYAERIAAFCLRDPLALDVKVRVEKIGVFANTDSVSAEIFRVR